MSFEEVSRIIPLSMRDLTLVTHGGAQFVFRLGRYKIWMRFDRPDLSHDSLPSARDMERCRLNLPPKLIDQQGRIIGDGPALRPNTEREFR